jgi:hypothetical protein
MRTPSPPTPRVADFILQPMIYNAANQGVSR